MDLSILIISFNTRELTLACLASVFAQTHRCAFEVIVVDNASSDGSADAIAAAYPQVKLIRLAENLGFARANNLAAKSAAGRWLLLLNPDTEILDGGIDQAMEFARSCAEDARSIDHVVQDDAQSADRLRLRGPECDRIIGGRTFFADGRLNYSSCHGGPTPWSVMCIALGLSAIFRRSQWLNPEGLGRWRRDTVREVPVVTGCFLMLERELWDRLGGFDESFFMYGEDTDLCLRARRLGARCVICPEARLIHHGGKSEKVRADKMIKLFNAKAQLFRAHWPPGRVRWGVAMLGLWCWTRMAGLRVLGWMRPSRRQGWRTWQEVWRRRSEWKDPAGTDAMMSVTCQDGSKIPMDLRRDQGSMYSAATGGAFSGLSYSKDGVSSPTRVSSSSPSRG